MKTGDNWSFQDDRPKCYGIQAKVLLIVDLRMRTARLDTERLRRPMIDAPYEFDIDHPVLPSIPDIPHWTLCVVRAESVWSHCHIVWRLSVSIDFGFVRLSIVGFWIIIYP